MGRLEAAAVAALHTKIHPTVTEELKAAVAKRGLRNFLTIELLAKGAFNEGWSSGQSATEPWVGHLTNDPDQILVPWLW